MVYAGDNDIVAGRSPEEILKDYQDFVALVRRSLPSTKIAFVAIKPSPSRWALAEKVKQANQLVRDYSSSDPSLVYIDAFTPMIGPNGRPRAELFVADSLHMTATGYALWRELLRPFVYGQNAVRSKAQE